MNPSPLQMLVELQGRAEAGPAERLALGEALLAIKEQRLYRSLGFDRFESFLDSPQCPFGHTVSRHAMRLAERHELHEALHLGIGRLTELMRLTPEQARQLLAMGLPTGPIEQVSVRTLRRHILRLQGRLTGQGQRAAALLPPEQLIEQWSEPDREQMLNLLLVRQFGQDLRRVQSLLNVSTVSSRRPAGELEAFWPNTRNGAPQRWVALTTHLEALERLLGADPERVQKLVQQLRQPLEAWERAVFYLDLCRREPSRREYFAQVRSACTAIEKILAGRDWHYNTDQRHLNARLARGRASRPATVRPFWRRLFNEVNPPQQLRDFLARLECEIVEGEWQILCEDIYQAEFALSCLRERSARLFWEIAAAHLEVQSIRLVWQEGHREREQRITLQSSAA